MKECPGRLEIARLKLDEGSKAVQAHFETCPKCQSILAELESSELVFEQSKEKIWSTLESSFDEIDAARGHKVTRPLWPSVRTLALAGGLAAAAAVTLILVTSAINPTPETEPAETYRYKGSLNVSVFAARDDRQFKVENGTDLMNGDEIRFIVNTESAGYLSVFSLDSAGALTPFYPDTAPGIDPSPLKIAGAGRHELPGGVTLDDVLGKERYVVVFSSEPFKRLDIHTLVLNSLADNNDSTLDSTNIKVRMLLVNKVPGL